MSRVRLAFAGVLTLLAVGAVASSSASAHGTQACIEIATPPFTGGYESECTVLEANGRGHFALALVRGAGAAARWWTCEKVSGAGTKYANHRCLVQETGGQWELVNTGIVPRALGTTTTSVLKGKAIGVKFEISCENSFKDELEEENKSKGTIEYTKCSVVKPSKCVVTEPIVAKFTDELVEEGGKLLTKLTGSGGGEEGLGEIEFKNKGSESCILKGFLFKIKGSQKCEFDKGELKEIETFADEQEIVCKASDSELTIGGEPATYEGTDKVMIEGGYDWSAA